MGKLRSLAFNISALIHVALLPFTQVDLRPDRGEGSFFCFNGFTPRWSADEQLSFAGGAASNRTEE